MVEIKEPNLATTIDYRRINDISEQRKKKRTGRTTITNTKTFIDEQTGEVLSTETESSTIFNKEDDFFKMYCNDFGILLGLSKAEISVFLTLASRMDYDNVICVIAPKRTILVEKSGTAEKTFQHALKVLRKKRLIYPLVNDGKEKRGWYVVNPDIVGKGSFAHIREIRLSLKYSNSGRSIKIKMKAEEDEFQPLIL